MRNQAASGERARSYRWERPSRTTTRARARGGREVNCAGAEASRRSTTFHLAHKASYSKQERMQAPSGKGARGWSERRPRSLPSRQRREALPRHLGPSGALKPGRAGGGTPREAATPRPRRSLDFARDWQAGRWRARETGGRSSSGQPPLPWPYFTEAAAGPPRATASANPRPQAG